MGRTLHSTSTACAATCPRAGEPLRPARGSRLSTKLYARIPLIISGPEASGAMEPVVPSPFHLEVRGLYAFRPACIF